MFEVIGIIILALFVWAIIKMIVYRINPEFGLKEAKRRYNEDPSEINERLLWEAKARVKKLKDKI